MAKFEVKTKDVVTDDGRVYTNLVLVLGGKEFPIQVVYGKTPNSKSTRYLADRVREMESNDNA